MATVYIIILIILFAFSLIYLGYKMNKIQAELVKTQDSTKRLMVILLGLIESMAKIAKNKDEKDKDGQHEQPKTD